MLKRFLLYILFLFLSIAVLNFVFKPFFSGSPVAIHSYKELTLSFKNLYVEYLWSGLKNTKNPQDRFVIIKRILMINPSYSPVYYEICNSLGDYMVSGISATEVANLIKSSENFANSEELIECYVNTLKLNSNLEEAIGFLEKLYNETSDPYKKGLYFERIKDMRDENNILNITRAIDTYNKKFLENPKDLSMLVQTGIIDRIPEDPFGGQYFISKEGRLRSTSVRSKEGHK